MQSLQEFYQQFDKLVEDSKNDTSKPAWANNPFTQQDLLKCFRKFLVGVIQDKIKSENGQKNFSIQDITNDVYKNYIDDRILKVLSSDLISTPVRDDAGVRSSAELDNEIRVIAKKELRDLVERVQQKLKDPAALAILAATHPFFDPLATKICQIESLRQVLENRLKESHAAFPADSKYLNDIRVELEKGKIANSLYVNELKKEQRGENLGNNSNVTCPLMNVVLDFEEFYQARYLPEPKEGSEFRFFPRISADKQILQIISRGKLPAKGKEDSKPGQGRCYWDCSYIEFLLLVSNKLIHTGDITTKPELHEELRISSFIGNDEKVKLLILMYFYRKMPAMFLDLYEVRTKYQDEDFFENKDLRIAQNPVAGIAQESAGTKKGWAFNFDQATLARCKQVYTNIANYSRSKKDDDLSKRYDATETLSDSSDSSGRSTSRSSSPHSGQGSYSRMARK